MWYSMLYLPLAEATVITFLAPMLAGYICHVLLKDPFTRKEQLASLIALAGVVLIARPTSLFDTAADTATATAPAGESAAESSSSSSSHPHHPPPPPGGGEPTPSQRLMAILVALTGVLGAAGAYSTIRYIGKRAHPLITVNYFSVWSTLVSVAGLLLGPSLGLDIGRGRETTTTTTTSSGSTSTSNGYLSGLLPGTAYEWSLLAGLGLSGFVMQFMMTAGIGGERSNRATAMVYTHMLFAAAFDRWVFGHRMGVVSLLGCGLIVGSALWAALGKKKKKAARGEGRRKDGEGEGEGDGEGEERDVERDGDGIGAGRRVGVGAAVGAGVGVEEAVPMLSGTGEDEDEEEEQEQENDEVVQLGRE